ncbi:MAG: V-type ATPase subunit [Anaerolineae bacterium]
MTDDYGYANARLRAMKSRLLDARTYEELLGKDEVSEIISSLTQTIYKPEIEAALVKYGGARCVTEALRLNFSRTMRKILSFFQGEPCRLLRILLGRWDVINIKTILRGQSRGVSPDEIMEALVLAGELDEVALGRMARQPDIKASIDLMATWGIVYARPLAIAMGVYAESEDLADLELALDKFYYDHAARQLKDRALQLRGGSYNIVLAREMLDAEIDVTNIMTILRLSRLRDRDEKLQAKYGTSDYETLLITSGGGLDSYQLSNLWAMTAVEDVVQGLARTPYGPFLEKGLAEYLQTGDMSSLQRGLERFVVRKGIGMFRRDPLSIAIAIGYIWAKYNEVVNLRIIAQGKAVGLDKAAIKRELILV